MSDDAAGDAQQIVLSVRRECNELKRWFLRDACPVWWELGSDRVHGGFHERLTPEGEPTHEPRRARLHPRQICAFRVADELGWNGPVEDAIRHALNYFLFHYQRPDGFYRAAVSPNGAVTDDSALLYDQAFALLGFAAAFDVLDDDPIRDKALRLLGVMNRRLKRPGGGFEEDESQQAHLTSNSNMHLLEAALAWMELDADDRWRELAAEIVELSLRHFRHDGAGPIREFFASDWTPAPGVVGSIVEPGHQFEWAWLLSRWGEVAGDPTAFTAARALLDDAESNGVDRARNVAINALLDDGSIRDSDARLWPQTERLRAACMAAETTGLTYYWEMTLAAAKSLGGYLQTPLRGLWHDVMTSDGKYPEQAAPASSFYHIAGAIAALDQTLHRLRA